MQEQKRRDGGYGRIAGTGPTFIHSTSPDHHQDSSKEQQQADIEKALALAGNDWRTGLFASKFYLEQGNITKAVELVRNFYGKNPQNYYLGLHYAKLLEQGKKYSACVDLLQKMKVLPNEGATEGRTIWRNANIGSALDLLNAKKYKRALESIVLAKQWPENLGVGKPYQVPTNDLKTLSPSNIIRNLKTARQLKR